MKDRASQTHNSKCALWTSHSFVPSPFLCALAIKHPTWSIFYRSPESKAHINATNHLVQALLVWNRCIKNTWPWFTYAFEKAPWYCTAYEIGKSKARNSPFAEFTLHICHGIEIRWIIKIYLRFSLFSQSDYMFPAFMWVESWKHKGPYSVCV